MDPLTLRNKRKEPASSSTVDSKLDKQKQKLQKACQAKNAGDILKIIGSYGSLATQIVTTKDDDGKATQAFPLSYLLLCENAQEAWMLEYDEVVDESIVRLVEAMWPCQLVQGDARTLPLPLACQNPSVTSATIQFLIQTYPAAVAIPYDGDSVLPIHLYLQRENPTLQTVELFSRIHPKALLEKESAMKCLNICLQNPACPNEIWRFLLEKYLAHHQQSFTLVKQDGMAEQAIDASKLEQLEPLLEQIEEFTCHVDTIHLEALFGLCTALSTLDNLSRLTLIIPNGYAHLIPSYTKWGLVNILRNNNLSHLHMEAPELEIPMDLVLEALQANSNLRSLTLHAKVVGCARERIEKVLSQTRLEELRLGPYGETFCFRSRD